MKYLKQLLIILLILSMLVSCDLFPFVDQTGTTAVPSTTTTTTTGKQDADLPHEDSEFIPPENAGPESDPYIGMSKEEFYANYTPATSYMDAYYRSLHYFMSGSIEEQDQAPTDAHYRPMEDGVYVRNSSTLYSDDGNTYYVLDSHGNIVNMIFRCGAYVTLEEVAAYVFAFGDVPANYSSSKRTKPTESPWGEYLRLNNSKFTGNTSKYPYEPELPDISGCGGDTTYYEIDIGTTGTDCDPAYKADVYNDGYTITRGAARIVYARFDKNGDLIIDDDEKFVFYTYNHYNDFREYLNYEGGWGEMFGNITGGGTISSKYDYNPTPYVAIVKRKLWNGDSTVKEREASVVEYAFFYLDKKYLYANAMST